MKTLYLTLILAFSFTLINAQSNVETIQKETKEVVVSSSDKTFEIDTLKIKEVISKTSDIRSYLNLERKVENIKLVFPKINRRKVA